MIKSTTFARPAKASGSLQLLRRQRVIPKYTLRSFRRHQSSANPSKVVGDTLETPRSITEYLSKPSWSISTLLPSQDLTPSSEPPITPKQLHHLLHLSALPAPASNSAEQASMLRTLSSQLHFLSAVRGVDTTGVAPLRALRDETTAAEREQEVTVEKVKDVLGREEVVGKWWVRRRRIQERVEDKDSPKDWKPLEHAQNAGGKFFFVDGRTGEEPSKS